MTMIDMSLRKEFEQWVETARPPLADEPALGLAALMTTAAFVDPVAQVPIFDAISDATGASSDPAERAARIADALPWTTDGKPRVALPRALWDGFWDIIARPPSPGDSELDLTLAVVALGNHYDRRMIDACEAALLEFDGVHELIAQPEVRLTTADLERHAADSLAHDLLSMLTANGYDIEVIDADTVVLPGDYPAQNRTNRRILQLHDVWHLVGGYGFTPAGEVAISGFQMAQFGQNYSTRFLATVATKAAVDMPALLDMLLSVTFDGWRHGRATRELIAVPWHHRIADPIERVRADLGIRPLDSAAVRMMEAFTPTMQEQGAP
ncbi:MULTISPECIES: Coq4 family protein [unclassified Sphingopyxis]|uniref:Coq4 family protein n=1 Tax=Sphingopyxis sp. DBS4 TaxID=2968500 RepID=UPI00214C5139|nr:Coq4 family protein [Sphingopyxis sp. DBS4]